MAILLIISACGGERRRPPSAGADAELNQCLRLSAKKRYQEAVECLEVYKSRYRAGARAADAELFIADNYFRQKDYLLAGETYQEFIRRFPYHRKVDYAYYQSGLAYLKDTPKAVDRDQQYLDLAVKNFEMVLKYFPNSPYHQLARGQHHLARSKQAHKHYYIGRFYYKYGEYRASIPRFESVIQKFPGVKYDEKSYYYLILAYLKTKQPDHAREAFLAFEKSHPRSSLVKKVKSKLIKS